MLALEDLLERTNALTTGIAILVLTQLGSWVYEYATTPTPPKGALKLRRLPGSLPFFQDTFTIIRNAHRLHDFFAEHAKTGNGVSTRWKLLGKPPVIELVTPQQLEDVQKNLVDNFPKGEYSRGVLRDLGGNSIFIVDGAEWVHQRKTAVNLFTTRMLRESMTATTHRLLKIVHRQITSAQDEGRPVDLWNLINRFTTQAFAETGFGVDFNCLEREGDHPFQEAYDQAQVVLMYRFVRPQWFWRFQRWANLGNEADFKKHMRVINETIYEIIAKSLEERNAQGKQAATSPPLAPRKADIISLFLDHQKTLPDGSIAPFDPEYLRDITLAFLGAGRDTTAVSLAWFFYALGNHPEVERKLRKELWEQLPELMKGLAVAPSYDDLQNLVYLDAVVKETLRLHTPVPTNYRFCEKSTMLSDGTFIPEGTSVIFQNYTLGRMTYIWGPDAEEFKPERWIDEATGKIKVVSPFKFNAFQGGPRMCIGITMSMTQIKMVASSLLSRYHFERTSTEPIRYDRGVVLLMKDPFHVRVHPAADGY